MQKLLTLALLGGAFAGAARAQNVPTNCVETLFAADNGGSMGGAVYFDITVTQGISFSGLLMNTVELTQVGLTVFTTPGTYIGQENNVAAWTQVAEDDGGSLGLGRDLMTPVTFVSSFNLAPGTCGMALMADNLTTGAQVGHDYTNGNGANQNYISADTVISLSLGAATNVPFAGNIFSPRVWNGRLCSGLPGMIGMNFCQATANSTGAAASMAGSGSSSVAANNLTLEVRDMPQHSFGLFLTSLTRGFTMNAGGSSGNFCLGGWIGLYSGPGQVQNSGNAGTISLLIDNTMHPTGMGFATVSAGETWNFTAWFRDTSGMGATSNFADGLEVLFN